MQHMRKCVYDRGCPTFSNTHVTQKHFLVEVLFSFEARLQNKDVPDLKLPSPAMLERDRG
jgi:hypothetical protein